MTTFSSLKHIVALAFRYRSIIVYVVWAANFSTRFINDTEHRSRTRNRKLLEKTRNKGPGQFSKSSSEANDGPPVISTLLQGRSLFARRDEGDHTALMHRQVLITGCVVFPGSGEEFYEGYNAYRPLSSLRRFPIGILWPFSLLFDFSDRKTGRTNKWHNRERRMKFG